MKLATLHSLPSTPSRPAGHGGSHAVKEHTAMPSSAHMHLIGDIGLNTRHGSTQGTGCSRSQRRTHRGRMGSQQALAGKPIQRAALDTATQTTQLLAANPATRCSRIAQSQNIIPIHGQLATGIAAGAHEWSLHDPWGNALRLNAIDCTTNTTRHLAPRSTRPPRQHTLRSSAH